MSQDFSATETVLLQYKPQSVTDLPDVILFNTSPSYEHSCWSSRRRVDKRLLAPSSVSCCDIRPTYLVCRCSKAASKMQHRDVSIYTNNAQVERPSPKYNEVSAMNAGSCSRASSRSTEVCTDRYGPVPCRQLVVLTSSANRRPKLQAPRRQWHGHFALPGRHAVSKSRRWSVLSDGAEHQQLSVGNSFVVQETHEHALSLSLSLY